MRYAMSRMFLVAFLSLSLGAANASPRERNAYASMKVGQEFATCAAYSKVGTAINGISETTRTKIQFMYDWYARAALTWSSQEVVAFNINFDMDRMFEQYQRGGRTFTVLYHKYHNKCANLIDSTEQRYEYWLGVHSGNKLGNTKQLTRSRPN